MGFAQSAAAKYLSVDLTRLNYQALPLRALRKGLGRIELQLPLLDRAIDAGNLVNN